MPVCTALRAKIAFIDSTWINTVRRFRSADSVTASAPLSEGAESITTPASDSEKLEKVEAREHVHVSKMVDIHQEEEQFEWREVVRGGNIAPGYRIYLTVHRLGITDVQTWLTGFAYFGCLVSLYSFSLFL